MEDDQTKAARQGEKPESQKLKSKIGKKIIMLVTTLTLVAASAGAGYYWGDKQANDQNQQALAGKDTQITQLKSDKADLQTKLDAAKAEEATMTETAPETIAACPSDESLSNIKAAVQSKNYAALEGYMANPVTVILAASEGLGPRTPANAVKDIEYLSGGTGTWDFSLPSAELSDYAAGFYTDYFPSDAYVGKSANNYLVSFTFTDDCKISGIFITGQTDLLL